MSNWLDLPNEPGFWWHLDIMWPVGCVELLEIASGHLSVTDRQTKILRSGSDSGYKITELGGKYLKLEVEKPAWPEDVIFEKQLHKISV